MINAFAYFRANSIMMPELRSLTETVKLTKTPAKILICPQIAVVVVVVAVVVMPVTTKVQKVCLSLNADG